MARILHLLKSAPGDLAAATIRGQRAAGDVVTVALLPGAGTPALPEGVTVRRLAADCSYAELLDEIFAADQVIAW